MHVRTTLFLVFSLFLALGLYAFGMVTGGFFAWFLFAFVATLILYEWLAFASFYTPMRVERRLSGRRLTSGQPLHFHTKVSFKWWMPRFWLQLSETGPNNLVVTGLDTVYIPTWKRQMTAEYTVRNLPRGVYHFRDLVVDQRDLLGLLRVQRKFEVDDRVTVYPKIVPVHGWGGLSPDDSMAKQTSNRRSEESSTIIGVRAYAPGDKLSRIHWPVTARTGELQAKDFELHVTSEFQFIPDNTVSSYPSAQQSQNHTPHEGATDALFELAMSITASLIDHASNHRRPWGMVVPLVPHTSIPSNNQPEQHARAMATLASLKHSSKRDFALFLRQVAQQDKSGRTFVIVSPKLDREMAVAISQLSGQNGVELFVPTSATGLNEEQRYAYQMMQQTGVHVHLIRDLEQLSTMKRGGEIRARN